MFLSKLNKQLSANQPLFIGEETAFRSAVLIPLVEVNGEWHILFEVRALTMRKQPGDSSFPGGRIDSTDLTPLDAALRETYEELGVHPNTVTNIQPLSPYVASPSFVVYPFVGVVDYEHIVADFNQEEVEEVFTVPVNWLLDYEPTMHLVSVQPTPASDFPFEKITNGTQYKWRPRPIEEWFYTYEGHTIWGLTARILKHFIEVIK